VIPDLDLGSLAQVVVPAPSTIFELNATTLAAMGSLMGVLAGTIIYLFRQLLTAKDQRIRALERDVDYWQSSYLGLLGTAGRSISLAERGAEFIPPRSRRAS
jgi:hypothetical protein